MNEQDPPVATPEPASSVRRKVWEAGRAAGLALPEDFNAFDRRVAEASSTEQPSFQQPLRPMSTPMNGAAGGASSGGPGGSPGAPFAGGPASAPGGAQGAPPVGAPKPAAFDAAGDAIVSLKDFERRAMDPRGPSIKNADGSFSTHRMASAEVDGRQIAYPTIVPMNGRLVQLDDDAAIDHALRTGEFREFNTERDAQAYAEGGYKRGTPLDRPLVRLPDMPPALAALPDGPINLSEGEAKTRAAITKKDDRIRERIQYENDVLIPQRQERAAAVTDNSFIPEDRRRYTYLNNAAPPPPAPGMPLAASQPDQRAMKAEEDYWKFANATGERSTQFSREERTQRIREGAWKPEQQAAYELDVLQHQADVLGGRAMRVNKLLTEGVGRDVLNAEIEDINAGKQYVQERMAELAQRDTRTFADKWRQAKQIITDATGSKTASQARQFLQGNAQMLTSAAGGALKLLDPSDGYTLADRFADAMEDVYANYGADIRSKAKGGAIQRDAQGNRRFSGEGFLGSLSQGAGSMLAIIGTGGAASTAGRAMGIAGSTGGTGVLAASYLQGYNDFIDSAERDGVKREDVDGIGMAYGLLYAAAERFINPQLLRAEMPAASKRFMDTIRAGKPVKEATKNFIEGGTKEFAEEMTQGVSEAAANYAANSLTGSKLDDEITADEAANTFLASFLLGGIADVGMNPNLGKSKAKKEALSWAVNNPQAAAEAINTHVPEDQRKGFYDKLAEVSKLYQGNDLNRFGTENAADMADLIARKQRLQAAIKEAPMDEALKGAIGDRREAEVTAIDQRLATLANNDQKPPSNAGQGGAGGSSGDAVTSPAPGTAKVAPLSPEDDALLEDDENDTGSPSTNEPTTPPPAVQGIQGEDQGGAPTAPPDTGAPPGVPPAPEPEATEPVTEEEDTERDRIMDDALMGGKAAEQRQAGKRIIAGQEYQRQEPKDAPTGKSGKVQFSDGIDADFEYVLMEAGDIQPSHNNGRRNPLHFIPEAQPKARTDKESKLAAQRIAEAPDLGKVSASPNAYSGAPIVNERGEVVQGNNRASGLKEHYSQGGEQYKQDLAERAAEFGLTPEQVQGMKAPVLVRRITVPDAKSIELGNYDSKDIETGGKRGIDPVAVSARIPSAAKGRIVDVVFADPNATMKASVRDNFGAVVRLLEPYLNPAQRSSLYRPGTSEPSAKGMDELEGLVKHFMFDGGPVELAEIFESGLPSMAQRGVEGAMPAIFSSPEAIPMVREVQNAIMAAAQFRASGVDSFDAWSVQSDAFGPSPKEDYTPTEIAMAKVLAEAKTAKGVKEKLVEYAGLTSGKEATMFDEATEGVPRQQAAEQVFGIKPKSDEQRADTEGVQKAPGRVTEEAPAAPKAKQSKGKVEKAAAQQTSIGQAPAQAEAPLPKKAEETPTVSTITEVSRDNDKSPTQVEYKISGWEGYTTVVRKRKGGWAMYILKDGNDYEVHGAGKEEPTPRLAAGSGAERLNRNREKVEQMLQGPQQQRPSGKAPVKTGKPRTDRVLKALRALLPDLSIIIPKTQEEYARITEGIKEGLSSGWGVYDPASRRIIVNPASPDLKQTLFHEAAHPVIAALMHNDRARFAKFYNEVVAEAGGKYARYGKQYGDQPLSTQQQEALVEYLADVAAGKIDISKGSLLERIADFLRGIMEALGFKADTIDLSRPDNVRSFARKLSNALNEGITITGLTPSTDPTVMWAKEMGISVEEAQRQYDAVVAQYTNKDGTKKEGWMKAPNGQATKLNERQWVQTRTPAFLNWFGDFLNDPKNASKVVDANGDPLVVYHGTKGDIEEFDVNRLTKNTSAKSAALGFFFTDFTYTADKFAGYSEVGGSVVPVYLKMDKPTIDTSSDFREKRDSEGFKTGTKIVDRYGVPIVEKDAYEKLRETVLSYGMEYGAFREKSISLGYDGVILRGTKMDGMGDISTHYVVFAPNQIKSATANTGQFGPAGNIMLQNDADRLVDGWYSRLNDAVNSKGRTQPASEWKNWVAARAKEGAFSLEEARWTGLNDWLDSKGKEKVTPEEVRDFLKENRVEVKVKVLGSPSEGDIEAFLNDEAGQGYSREDAIEYLNKEEGATKFSQYQLPGGKNYREVLVTLPNKQPVDDVSGERASMVPEKDEYGWRVPGFSTHYPTPDQAIDGAMEIRGFEAANKSKERAELFRSSHFDEPNILVHLRLNDRTDADGRRVLFIEELQSDWAQRGRKEGFSEKLTTAEQQELDDIRAKVRSAEFDPTTPQERARANELIAKSKAEGTPSAPFVTSTEGWVELGLKQAIRMAVDGGPSPAWADATKPKSIREEFDNHLSPELASVLPLEVVNASVLAASKNDEVRRAIVAAIPVDVVNILSKHGVSPESLVTKSDVFGNRIPVESRAAVARGFADALQLVGTRLRTALDGVLSEKAAGRDRELLPAIRARDLDPGVVAGLLAPSRIYGGSKAGRDVTLSGSGGAGSTAKPSGSVAPDVGLAGKGRELSSAELAVALNRHDAILTNRTDDGKKFEPGYEILAWASGEQQNERYDLSKQVSTVNYAKRGDGKYQVVVMGLDGNQVYNSALAENELEDVVGKEVAKKIVEGNGSKTSGGFTELSGDGLKVGGSGMKGFYDKILPIMAGKVGKKLGGDGKVQPVTLGTPEDAATEVGTQQSIDITPAMRDKVMAGVPMMQQPRKGDPDPAKVSAFAATLNARGLTPQQARAHMEARGFKSRTIDAVIAAMTGAPQGSLFNQPPGGGSNTGRMGGAAGGSGTTPPSPPPPPGAPGTPGGRPVMTPAQVQAILDRQRADARGRQRGWRRRIWEAWVKAFEHRRGVADRMLKENSLDPAGAARAITLKNLAAGASNVAKDAFRKYHDAVHKGLSQQEKERLDDLIQLRRTVAVDERRDAQLRERVDNPGGMAAEDARRALDDMRRSDPTLFAKLDARADSYFAAMSDLLRQSYDAGLITKEVYDDLKDDEYSPRKFIHHMLDAETRMSVGGMDITGNGIKNLTTGSEESLYNNSEWLLAAHALSTYKRIYNNEANKALHAHIATLGTHHDNPGVGYVLREGETSRPGYTRIGSFVDGKEQAVAVMNEIAVPWTTNDPVIRRDAANAIRIVTGGAFKRLAITGANPAFALSNVPRDIAHALLFTDTYSNALPVALAQIGADIKAVSADVWGRKGRYAEYINEGGGMDLLTHQGRPLTGASVSMEKGIGERVLHVAGYINETSELLVRLAIREREIRKAVAAYERANGAAPGRKALADIKRMATAKAREQMDFSQGGEWSKAIDTFIPYFNATLQGTRVMARSMRNDPTRFAVKLAQLGALSVALVLYNMDFDEWDEVPDHEKENNFIIFLPFMRTGRNGQKQRMYLKIPKSQDQRAFAGGFEGMTEWANGGKFPTKRSIHTLLEAAPIKPDFILDIPLADAMYAYATGFDRFHGDFISHRMRPVEPWKEYRPGKTEQFYRDMGLLTSRKDEEGDRVGGISPERLKLAVGKYTGLTEGNVFHEYMNKGYAAAAGAMDKEGSDEMNKRMGEHVEELTAPFTRRMVGWSDPEKTRENPLERYSRKEATRRELLNDEVKEGLARYREAKTDAERSKADAAMKKAVAAMPAADQKRAADRYATGRKQTGVDYVLIDILHEPVAAVRARAFLDLWLPKDENGRKRMQEQAEKIGLTTKTFMDEFARAYAKDVEVEKEKAEAE